MTPRALIEILDRGCHVNFARDNPRHEWSELKFPHICERHGKEAAARIRELEAEVDRLKGAGPS